MISRFLVDSFAIQSAMPVLLDAALKGALLVVIAAAAAYALRKRSAASRHAVWTASVIGHLAIPALMLLLPAWKIPLLPAAPWMPTETTALSAASISAGADEGAARVVASPIADVEKQAAAPTPSTPSSGPAIGAHDLGSPTIAATTSQRPGALAIVAAIWFVGALIVLLRLAIG